ncbi:cytochrome P450 [Cercophora scortea]|uniref:Cytochrome P450 n=1 Tax=Cercophora scortea TaxID=314031 RepID=A0AAE0MIR3_9PEZI|nr:cytochrome P450 [Cercophora scortea]
MASSWLLVLLVAVPLLLAGTLLMQTVLGLARNYASARTIGVPIRFILISPFNPFWTLVDRAVLSFIRRLPGPLGRNSFTRYNWRGWEVADRYQSHREMGDIWVLVTPFKNWIYVNDPDALNLLFRRGNDFPRPVFATAILDVFGPNISTAEGQAWKTQRKMAAHSFNEQNNEIVWSESLTLATDMLKYWTSKPSIDTAASDLRTLSLHTQRPSVNSAANYKDSLQTIVENCVLILGLGTSFIAQPWLPKKLRDLYAAYVSFRAYMTSLYEEEKAAYAAGETGEPNLMRSMVRASQADAEDGGGLTEAEIYGNMFDWLHEEIHRVFGDAPVEKWDYRANFPRLKRCLSVLYETIRIYVPVPTIKWTADKAQPLVFGGRTYVLPANSMIAPSYGSIQTDPRFWGANSLNWDPSRFIVKSAEDGEEELRVPVRGSFIGWSDGARDCPGRKFSHVEFAATMAVLFRGDWRVRPAPKYAGESPEAARSRVLDLIKNDSGSVLLLQMLHPERAPLLWEKR